MMETNDPNQPANDTLELSRESLGYLNEIRKWALFLAIIGFVFVTFMVIAAFSIGALFSSMGQNANMPIPPSFFGLLYFVMALIYFFPIFYLFKFASHAREGILGKRQGQLDLAFMNMKSHYKFMGILMIVMLCLYVIMGVILVVVLMVAPGSSASRRNGLQISDYRLQISDYL